MTRLYGIDFICESCHRPGPFGWVYRCTQDRDELIEQAASRGYTTAFDELGQVLTEELGIRKGSPAAREDKLSFLDEMNPEQLAMYRPDQVATILRQRENVSKGLSSEQQRAVLNDGQLHNEIQRERLRKNSAVLLGPFRQTNGINDRAQDFNYSSRWICADDEECQFKVCPFCRPGYADRSFLSLTGAAHGELSPTAATGFGFHVLGERPVVDATILKSIGLRPPPPSRSEITFSESSFASELSMIEMLEDQIARSRGLWQNSHCASELDQEAILSLLPSTPGQLTQSPGCDNLGAYEQPIKDLEKEPEGAPRKHPQNTPQGDFVRPHDPIHEYKIDCVVMEHVGCVSTPEVDESTDYLLKISGPGTEAQHTGS
ncbi:hypothetical protein G7Z17_g6594 [Cylindrodendrum hubeiense]|uniref:Uncharacterized protein n=1 Tax=Cylindrodendrum hubeiense TaxID=595255 RepID=A0A9P5HCV2_9HYPO|nr:hypothetical protein G7Z17_g6594 [Cylindrodendrum hubeiense]